MGLKVVDTAETYRLVCQEQTVNRWAVVEVRCGRAYSLDPHHSREAPATPEGIAQVVGDNGWEDEEAARRCFEEAVKGERHYSETIW